MTSATTPNRPSRRNKILTAASIGAVVLAGLFAIGANLGILSSADRSNVGTVAAAGDLVPTSTQVVDVYLDAQGNPLASNSTAPAGSQPFTVDSAGTVYVSTVGGSARVDLVKPASGWTATPATTTGNGVAISFTDGTRTLDFTATVGPDGTVTGEVTESTSAAPVPKPTSNHEYEGGESDD